MDGLATCVCSEACPLTLMPVCGSDGYSYPNNCSLEVEACTSGKNLTVIAMGECGKLPHHSVFVPSYSFRCIFCGQVQSERKLSLFCYAMVQEFGTVFLKVSEYSPNINLKFLCISSFYVFWNWRILMLTHLL